MEVPKTMPVAVVLTLSAACVACEKNEPNPQSPSARFISAYQSSLNDHFPTKKSEETMTLGDALLNAARNCDFRNQQDSPAFKCLEDAIAAEILIHPDDRQSTMQYMREEYRRLTVNNGLLNHPDFTWYPAH
jgi:hypothetical protein